jgi:uncharacterized protein (DUF305 family)
MVNMSMLFGDYNKLILYIRMNIETGPTKKNPCTDYLSDLEYLDHMVPHHQVAVDMSKMLELVTADPEMKSICRGIIYSQRYEISEMITIRNSFPDSLSENGNSHKRLETKSNIYWPIKSKSNGNDCDPLFFDPEAHMKHAKNKPITDKSYLTHMIPHHQAAVDMSQRLLLHTNHTYLHGLVYRIILNQKQEILKFNEMLETIDNVFTWKYNSELLGTNNHNYFYDNEDSLLMDPRLNFVSTYNYAVGKPKVESIHQSYDLTMNHFKNTL